jgi:hypothetical protein
LRTRFLELADSEQPGGLSAEDFFDDATISGDALASTFRFFAGGESRAFIVIRDSVILGRASILRTSDGARAPVTLLGVLVHELTHAADRFSTGRGSAGQPLSPRGEWRGASTWKARWPRVRLPSWL